MPTIVLRTENAQHEPLTATFDPDNGMRLTSLRKGNVELLGGANSGPIGPHFGALHPGLNPENFVDGIARYAPWKATATDNSVRAQLGGKDEWKGKTIAALEGQTFKMEMVATLTESGLAIDISVVADSDAVVGYGCHFKVEKGHAKVTSDDGNLDLVDAIFHPTRDALAANIQLETGRHEVQLRYQCQNAENSWQLKYHPEHATVYLAALAAKSPARPVLTVNAIHIDIVV